MSLATRMASGSDKELFEPACLPAGSATISLTNIHALWVGARG